MDNYEPSADKVKKRKIRRSDWQKVEDFLKRELQKRKDNDFRKQHERIWKEVDRQIAMEPMAKIGPQGKPLPPGWQSAFELGELAKASEVTTAAVMRLVFPFNRTYFEAHTKPPMTVDPESGRPKPMVNENQVKKADGIQRSLMAQQQLDFGHKARVEISVKECLHHGSFVAAVEWETQNKVHDGQGLESLSAPVWVPNSMWNCYPDSSPAVIPGANIFYTGSMMIVSYMPRYKVLQLKGEGYMNIDPKKILKKKNTNKDVETEDVEIVTYYGDLNMEREDGDIYLPNSKCKTANGTVIYYKANDLPFPEVIYQGYERQDVRDPYFTSPIIKNSPMQKMTTILANKFIDSVDLHTVPPVVYDGNDPYMVQNGGVNMWPGAQTPSKGSNKFQEVKVGDPKAALMGLQFGLQKIEEGTGVNAIRAGASDSDRKTATEVRDTQQGAELRTADFVGKLEAGGLRPFLYMQHELNLRYMTSYSFYCAEKELPDFMVVKKKDLPKVVHFEVVGSKGVLGEERRTQQMTQVTAWALGNPITAPLVNAPKVLIDMYEDAGVKGAEMYVNTKGPQIPPQVQAQLQQAQQVIQELQQKLQEAQQNMQAKMAEVQLKAKVAQEEMALDRQKAQAEHTLEAQKMVREFQLKQEELRQEIIAQQKQMAADFQLALLQLAADTKIAAATANAKGNGEGKPAKQIRDINITVPAVAGKRKIKFSDGESAEIE
jgi:hypothetical protein